MGVDSLGNFYVSDYYHNVIDVYEPNANYAATNPKPTGATGFLGQVSGSDPDDGPCALSFDASDRLYANVFHRSIVRFDGQAATVIAGQGVEETHPTGVAVDPASGHVYVDERTYIGVFDSTGAPVMDEGEPLRIGSLEGGYGVAVSQFPGTAGRLYVATASTNTIEVFDPAVDTTQPVETIDGTATPPGQFVSLRDSAVAVDRATGEVYVVDNLQPADTERPRALIDVFAPDGEYEGHLKFMVVDPMPVGLAVDNSQSARHPLGTQGRVYVTFGNTEGGAIYAYPPGAATTAPISLPAAVPTLTIAGSGEETIRRQSAEVEAPDTAAGGAAGAEPTARRTQRRKRRHHRRVRHHRAHRLQARIDGNGVAR